MDIVSFLGVTVLALGVGFFLHDFFLRWRSQGLSQRWQTRLEEATRQSEEMVRTLRSELAYQQKALKMLESALNEGRRTQRTSQAEMANAQDLARQLERQVEAFRKQARLDRLARPADAAAADSPTAGPRHAGPPQAGTSPLETEEQKRELRSLADHLAASRQALQASREALSKSKDNNRTRELEREAAVRILVETGSAVGAGNKELTANLTRPKQEAPPPRSLEEEPLVVSLRQDLKASHEALMQCDQKLDQRESMVAQLEAKVRTATKAAVTEHELRETTKQTVAEHELELETKYLTLVAEKDQRITDLEAELQQLEVQQPEAPESREPQSPPVEPDDLTEIRGIGPVLEQRLNALGISSYYQIALWDDAEIERISPELGKFRNRVRKDNWVDGAAEQYARKYLRT